jgi:hypothetical protein
MFTPHKSFDPLGFPQRACASRTSAQARAPISNEPKRAVDSAAVGNHNH